MLIPNDTTGAAGAAADTTATTTTPGDTGTANSDGAAGQPPADNVNATPPATEENSADTIDMIEEVEAALEDEVTDGGKDKSLARKRELQRRLQDWRDEQAVLKKMATDDVFSREMHEATDIRSYRKERTKARRRAFEAQERGDRAAVTRWKRKELYHHYQIVAARRARKLRERIKSKYSPGALRSLMDAAEHDSRIEFEYSQSMARLSVRTPARPFPSLATICAHRVHDGEFACIYGAGRSTPLCTDSSRLCRCFTTAHYRTKIPLPTI